MPENSSTSFGGVIAVSKDGPQMSEETLNAIKNGGLPFIEKILIGKQVNLQ